MRLDLRLLRRHVKTRRAINAVAIQQRHRWHLQFGAARYQAFGQGRPFEEAERGTRMKLYVHRVIWSSDHRMIFPNSNHPMARSPDRPIHLSHSSPRSSTPHLPDHAPVDTVQFPLSPAPQCPIHHATTHPSPTTPEILASVSSSFSGSGEEGRNNPFCAGLGFAGSIRNRTFTTGAPGGCDFKSSCSNFRNVFASRNGTGK